MNKVTVTDAGSNRPRLAPNCPPDIELLVLAHLFGEHDPVPGWARFTELSSAALRPSVAVNDGHGCHAPRARIQFRECAVRLERDSVLCEPDLSGTVDHRIMDSDDAVHANRRSL